MSDWKESKAIVDAQKEWEKHFPSFPPILNFCIVILSSLYCAPILDVIKLDRFLELQFPSCRDADNISMAQFIERKYGKDACDFVRKLLVCPQKKGDSK